MSNKNIKQMKGSHRSILHPYRAWIIWFLGAFFMFYKYALEVSPSVMTSQLMGAFQINGATLGNLVASYFYAYLIFQIPAGMLLDKIGPRKITTFAIVLCAMGSVMFASVDSFFAAWIGRFLMGAGAAFAAVSCLKLVSNWFAHKQFAFMAGLMMTFAMFGAVIGQAPLVAFIKALEWRTAMLYIGFFGILFGFVFYLVVRDRPDDTKKHKGKTQPSLGVFESLRKILKNPQTWWLSLYSGFAFAPVMVFGGLWGVSFISEAYRLEQSMAAQAVSLIFIGFAVGAPVLGWFSNWIGKRRIVMFWGTLVALLTISAVVYTPGLSNTFLMALLFLFGFSISGFLLCFTMLTEITSSVLVGTAIGFMNAFDALFGALTDPLTGKFLDMSWTGKLLEGARIYSIDSYKLAFLILPITLILALITLIGIKETHCKPIAPVALP